MSRDFSKNIANYMTLPNADAALLSGAITAFSIWAKPRSIDVGTFHNFLFSAPNTGSTASAWASGLFISSGANVLYLRGRPTAADTLSTSTGTTTFSAGVWNHFSGQSDWANDRQYLSTNGVVETFVGTGWTATAFDGGATVGAFRIGQTSVAPASFSALNSFDGLLAHAAFWVLSSPFADAEFAALAQGVSPMLIRPLELQLYRPLYGFDIQEPDYVSHGLVTITGSVPSGIGEPPVQEIFESNGSTVETIAAASTAAIASRVLQMRKTA